MPKTLVYSQRDFDALCSSEGWDDSNVETLGDKAFISICCSGTSREALGQTVYGTRRSHWFAEDHPNVLNVDFDDVEEDTPWESPSGVRGEYRRITPEQAEAIYRFAERNAGRDFYIHCSAGVSRSQGVGLFIRDFFPEYGYGEREENPCVTPNARVVSELKRRWYEDRGFGF